MDFFFPLIPCLEYFLIPVKKEILLITVRILWSDVTFLSSLACVQRASLHAEAARPLVQLHNLLLASGCVSLCHHILENLKVSSAHAGTREAAPLLGSTIRVRLAELDRYKYPLIQSVRSTE